MRFPIICAVIVLGGIFSKADAQSVSYTGKQITLQDFFSAITAQTGYTVFYNNEVISRSHPVDLQLQNASLEYALKDAFKNQPFSFKIHGNTIFVSVTMSSQNIQANDVQHPQILRGTVMDSLHHAISRATVTLNNGKSAMTDEAGNFTMSVNIKDSLLTVSCIGFENKTVRISSADLIVTLNTTVNPLEQVVVGGNMAAIKRKAETTSLTVIDAKTLDALPVNDISQIYRGLVPGTNSFSTGDVVENTSTLSIRGSGTSQPISVYVDGIEYAGGSGYLYTLNKQNLDRVEVLRGPSSSTLYGTGSNGGILQIYTREPVPGQNSLKFTASGGFIRSKWVDTDPFQQFYNVESVSGMNKAAVQLGGSFMSYGPFLPEGGGRTATVYAGVKWEPSPRFTTDFIVQYEHARRHISRNPEFDSATHPNATAISMNFGPALSPHKDIDQESFLIGANLNYRTTAHWTNHFTAGYSQNGYNEIPVTNDSGNVPLNRYYFIEINKTTTLRYFNDLDWGDKTNNSFALHVMSGLEYKRYFFEQTFVSSPYSSNFSGDPPNENYGVFAQINPSYKNIFLTMALRYDHNQLFKNNGSYNPRIGITTNFTIQNTYIIKPRIAWGSGITAPTYMSRFGDPNLGISPNPNIKPQDQQGFEYGLEFFGKKKKFHFEIIYYDNLLKNMSVLANLPAVGSASYYQFINAGVVANKGWEFSGSLKVNDHFSLQCTFSAMSSLVKDTTGVGNSNNLDNETPGSQLTNLPRHTAGLFMNYTCIRTPVLKGRLDISFNITEVDGTKGFDDISFETDLAYGRTSDTIPHFDAPYYKKTGVIIQLGLNVDYFLKDNLRFFIQGSNIANNNAFVDGTTYPTHGASWMFGIKYNMAH